MKLSQTALRHMRMPTRDRLWERHPGPSSKHTLNKFTVHACPCMHETYIIQSYQTDIKCDSREALHLHAHLIPLYIIQD